MLAELEHQLLEWLTPTSEETRQSSLYAAARYSTFNPGGKRLRPLLLLTSAKILGVSLNQAIPVACAVELIHTYSLIHDDMPCIDNDAIRRNKPSLHCQYTEGIALLTGDFLLTHAIHKLSLSNQISADHRLRLIIALTAACGIDGMIGGQYIDITTQQDVEWIHLKKTGALMAFATSASAILADLPTEKVQAWKDFGSTFGLLFQIADDLHDRYSQESVCSCLNNMTYDEALAYAKTLQSRLLTWIDQHTNNHPLLIELAKSIIFS